MTTTPTPFRPGAPQAASPASPCINVCRMDARTGLCEGCFRSLAEIAAWGGADADEKRAILREVAARRAAADLFEGDLRGDCDRP